MLRGCSATPARGNIGEKSKLTMQKKKKMGNYFALWKIGHKAAVDADKQAHSGTSSMGVDSVNLTFDEKDLKPEDSDLTLPSAEDATDAMVTAGRDAVARVASGFPFALGVDAASNKTESELPKSSKPVMLGMPAQISDEPKPVFEIVGEIMEDWSAVMKVNVHTHDASFLSAVQFWRIMRDPQFVKEIAKAEIRPDQVCMLFQKLDPMDMGCISVEDFIDGLPLIKSPVQGVDVSSAKSMSRRLHLSGKKMRLDASQLQDVFLDLVSELRGIVMIGEHKHLDEQVDNRSAHQIHEDEANITMHAKQRVLTEQNSRLRKKIERVKGHIQNRVLLAEQNGDLHMSSHVEGLGCDEDNISITSAVSGLD